MRHLCWTLAIVDTLLMLKTLPRDQRKTLKTHLTLCKVASHSQLSIHAAALKISYHLETKADQISTNLSVCYFGGCLQSLSRVSSAITITTTTDLSIFSYPKCHRGVQEAVVRSIVST